MECKMVKTVIATTIWCLAIRIYTLVEDVRNINEYETACRSHKRCGDCGSIRIQDFGLISSVSSFSST